MTEHVFRRLARAGSGQRIALFLLCVLGAGVAAAQSVSPAEELLFLANHMRNISEPASLTYSFKKEGGAEQGFDDDVRLDVTRINPDKSVAVSLRFLSEGRAVDLPQIGDATGNPVLLGFLERDIIEMNRLTGGAANFFRKRIRLALADVKQLHPVRFTYAGKVRNGHEVRIQPYLDDPLRERFKEHADKSYVFVISDVVPGSVYQIRTASGGTAYMDKPSSKGKAGMTETLTLAKVGPLRPAPKKTR